MPFDLVGFVEATPGTGVVPLNGGLGDRLYSIVGDDLIVKTDAATLLGVFAHAISTGGESMVRQPSLHIDHRFLKCALSTDIDPSQAENMCLRGLPLKGGEKLNVLIVNATDESALVGLLLGSAPITQAMIDSVRPTHRITGYADTTQGVNTWTDNVMTWNEDVPEGTYAIVGMRATIFKAATPEIALARVLCPSATNWRPGVAAGIAEADHEESQSLTRMPFTRFPLMREVVFKSNSPPSIETLAAPAHTDLNVELELQKIA